MNLQELTSRCSEVVATVAAYIAEEFAAYDRSRAQLKSPGNLVTHVDLESEKMLVAKLRGILPDAGFLTEEETQDTHGSGYRWVIDPLDGTTNFAHGVPCFAISVALLDPDDRPLVGVIHEVSRNEQFRTWRGGGAWLGDRRLSVTENADMTKSLFATGFPFDARNRAREFMDTFNALLLACHALRRIGSASVDLAYVAAGRFDGYYEPELNPWDVAAGVLLVQEAGGVVTDFNGGDDSIFGRSIAAANLHLHPRLLEVIQRNYNKA